MCISTLQRKQNQLFKPMIWVGGAWQVGFDSIQPTDYKPEGNEGMLWPPDCYIELKDN